MIPLPTGGYPLITFGGSVNPCDPHGAPNPRCATWLRGSPGPASASVISTRSTPDVRHLPTSPRSGGGLTLARTRTIPKR
jgi:hypothetical protein